ncbi:MAG: hypothetical protein EAX89_06640 [Candidatus Lokiarchaeota archaeon]|nr:hypothetical protein [Candidatus Lokiarchaeota archaeon]
MSNEKENDVDMDSIHLFDYLKKEIPVDELRDFDSPKRIVSIDFVKGFAIVFIILAHTAGAWLNSSWIFIYGIVFSFLDILGPSLFIFLSALSVVFSIKRKKGSLSNKVIRNRILNRGIIIIVIAIIFNIFAFEFTIEGYTFPLNLWGWNILMFIGFSQIFSLYALKIGKMARAVLGAVIIFTSDPIRQFLFEGKEAGNLFISFLHYIIVSPSPMTPLLPWISICFISTIFGEYLYDAMMMGKKQDYIVLFRTFLYWGLFFVIMGIFLGRYSYAPATFYSPANDLIVGSLPLNEYPHIGLLYDMNSQIIIPEIRYPGMWEFLIRGRAPNMIYNLGAALLIIAISFYFIDIKDKSNTFISMLIYYGKVSLSLFLIHYTFIMLFIWYFDIVIFPFIWLGYVGFMGFLMYVWNEFFNGVGSPEWLMVQIGRIGQKTGKTVMKEMQIIEDELKGTIHKLKRHEHDSEN